MQICIYLKTEKKLGCHHSFAIGFQDCILSQAYNLQCSPHCVPHITKAFSNVIHQHHWDYNEKPEHLGQQNLIPCQQILH